MNLLDIITTKHTFNEILKAARLDRNKLKKTLRRLQQDGLIFKNYKDEYHLLYSSKLYQDSFYYVLLDDQRFIVKPRDLNRAQVGDTVKFYLYHGAEERFADIVFITNHVNVVFTSTIHYYKKTPYLTYKDKYYALPSNIEINENYLYKAYLNRKKDKLDKVEIINTDPNTNYIYELASTYGFYDEYRYLEDEQLETTLTDLKGRTSFIDDYVVTIDGSATLDFDDAFSLTFKDNVYYLNVHIADVSHFVEHNSKLDLTARKKGTSLYLADIVLPMLPKSLSEGVCSLSEGNTRLTLSTLMQIDLNGNVLNYDFKLGYISVKKKLTYEFVNDYYDHKVTIADQNLKELLDHAFKLNEILERKYIKDGKLEFLIPEYAFKFDNDHHPLQIFKNEQRSAEKLIENFMVTTNTVVAKFLATNKINTIYRFHDVPSKERFLDFLPLIKDIVELPKFYELDQKFYAYLIRELAKTPLAEIYNQELLRTLAKACYTPDNTEHFGLGLTYYLHFTSPIRRYPDLIVHRILKAHLLKQRLTIPELPEISNIASTQERKALDAERAMFTVLSAMYLEDKVGTKYSGIITSVTKFGLFVNIGGIDGLVLIDTLTNPYYDQKKQQIETFINTYRLGDEVDVILVALDQTKGHIDFIIEGDNACEFLK